MTKILNLDEVMPTEVRELVLGGKTHPITEMTVEDYIETTKAAVALKKADEETQIRETARLIARQVPSLDEQLLLKQTVEKLYAISEFVRGVDPEKIIARVSGQVQQALTGTTGERAEGAEGK